MMMHLRAAGLIVIVLAVAGCASWRSAGSAPKEDCRARPTIPMTDATITYLEKNDRPHLEADVITNETLEKECAVKAPNP